MDDMPTQIRKDMDKMIIREILEEIDCSCTIYLDPSYYRAECVRCRKLRELD